MKKSHREERELLIVVVGFISPLENKDLIFQRNKQIKGYQQQVCVHSAHPHFL